MDRKYSLWSRQDDETLVQMLIEHQGSLKSACKAAAARLGRSYQGAKSRMRDLRQNAEYYRTTSVSDNGIRLVGSPGAFSVRYTKAAPSRPQNLLTPTTPSAPSGPNYTVQIRGVEVTGSSQALRDILGLH
ncbi:MAG: hypothetical protein ACO32S_05550 [Steroidobacteraceae bacterium]